MFLLMIVLGMGGIGMLLAAPLLARAILGTGRDPIGATRVLQLVGVLLLITALFIRPRNPETSAVPPPPLTPESQDR